MMDEYTGTVGQLLRTTYRQKVQHDPVHIEKP